MCCVVSVTAGLFDPSMSNIVEPSLVTYITVGFLVAFPPWQEAFMRGTEKYAHETQLSKRVGAWQDKLEPLMRRRVCGNLPGGAGTHCIGSNFTRFPSCTGIEVV